MVERFLPPPPLVALCEPPRWRGRLVGVMRGGGEGAGGRHGPVAAEAPPARGTNGAGPGAEKYWAPPPAGGGWYGEGVPVCAWAGGGVAAPAWAAKPGSGRPAAAGSSKLSSSTSLSSSSSASSSSSRSSSSSSQCKDAPQLAPDGSSPLTKEGAPMDECEVRGSVRGSGLGSVWGSVRGSGSGWVRGSAWGLVQCSAWG